VLPDWEQIHQDLKKRNVTLRLLWTEYREDHPDGYGYSQFCDLFRRYVRKLDPPMRQNHKAGGKLFVDYAGDTVPITDPETGEIRQAQIFVATLGASSYTYAEAQPSQEMPHWSGGHVRAHTFFDVTEIIVPDNLTQGLKHACRMEIQMENLIELWEINIESSSNRHQFQPALSIQETDPGLGFLAQ